MKSYYVDKALNRIVGTVNDKEAYLQYVKKTLSTDKHYWNCYSKNYGIQNMQRYIGKRKGYIMAHFPKDVEECLLTDPFQRTKSIVNYEYEDVVGGVKISCVINSVYGEIPYTATYKI